MDLLLSNTRKISSLIRSVLTGAGMLYVGMKVGSQADVDGLVSGVDTVFTNFDSLVAAGLAAVGTASGIYAKIKAVFAE